MVAIEDEFKIDLTKLSDKELQIRRLNFVSGLFDGEKGSRDNVKKEALIREIDIERELRFKSDAVKKSNWAILISIISLLISGVALYFKQ